MIEAIHPHIYTKGGDYTPDSLIDEERALLDRLGIEIRILSLVPGKSTSATLSDMAEAADRPKRVAILGSGTGSNARSILQAAADGKLGGEVALVMSDVSNAGILNIAAEFGVPAIAIDPGTTKGGYLTDAALKEILDRLQAASIDLVALAGFTRIVREPLLSAFAGKMLNLHPSLLPKYPGLHACKKAIDSGDAESGCTIPSRRCWGRHRGNSSAGASPYPTRRYSRSPPGAYSDEGACRVSQGNLRTVEVDLALFGVDSLRRESS